MDYLKELGELAEINEPVSETYYKGSSRNRYHYTQIRIAGYPCREKDFHL